MKIYEGLFLASNCVIEKMRLENLDESPNDITAAGRMWFDSINNEVKVSIEVAENFIEKTLLFKEDLPQALTDLNVLNQDAGWRDELGSFNSAKTNKTSEPIWADIGNGIFAYHFSDDKDMEVFISYHINHSFKFNSAVFPHIHWIPIGNHTGVVRWKIEYALAKGYQRGNSLTIPLTTIILEQNAQQMVESDHHIVEATKAQSFIVEEPDTMIVCKISRESTHPNDTFIGSVAGLTMDLHVYSDGNETTPGKNFPFDVEELPTLGSEV